MGPLGLDGPEARLPSISHAGQRHTGRSGVAAGSLAWAAGIEWARAEGPPQGNMHPGEFGPLLAPQALSRLECECGSKVGTGPHLGIFFPLSQWGTST